VLGAFLSAVSYFYVNIQNGWPEKLLASGEDVVYYKATAMALAAIVFTQIGAVFNCRTEKESVFKAGIFKNKQVIYGIIFEVFLIVMLVYLPLFQKVFHTAALSLTDWLLLCIWPIVIVLLEEIRKYFIRKRGK
jgi:magnesium-transporting ATPase (P-type)